MVTVNMFGILVWVYFKTLEPEHNCQICFTNQK